MLELPDISIYVEALEKRVRVAGQVRAVVSLRLRSPLPWQAQMA